MVHDMGTPAAVADSQAPVTTTSILFAAASLRREPTLRVLVLATAAACLMTRPNLV